MKTKLLTLFLALTASVVTICASDTQVDGIWYNFNDSDYTASVTYQGDSYSSFTEYSGEVAIPSSVLYNNHTYHVTSIGEEAFCGCSSITSVTIPNSITSIGNYAFEGCCSLTTPIYNTHVFAFMPISYSGEYTIPDKIKSIAGGAFYKCTGLTSVTIPNSVTIIGGGAFLECSSLTSITIPDSVTRIGGNAFADCVNLTSVTFPNSIISIGNSVFRGCTRLSEPVYNAHIFAFMPTYYSGTYTIPKGIESIAGYAFSGCSNLTSVTISNNVTCIGGGAFQYCSGLTSVTIPNSVTRIESSAFRNCSRLSSITIPNSVTSIESGVFMACGLTSVEIPNSVTNIGEKAFYNCRDIENIVFGRSLDSIGYGSFQKCSNINIITCYRERPPTIYQEGSIYLSFPDKMPSSTLVYVPADYLNDYKAHDFWGQYDVRALEAESVEADEVKVESTTTTADVVWPAVENAYTYELVIKEKQGNIICTLIFNANGQLTSIEFSSPARDNSAEQVQEAGFSFTVTGLDSGTTYNLTITAKDSNGQTLQTTTQTFTTEELTGVEDIVTNCTPTKVIRNGQLFILRGDKTYTVQGQEVR